MGMEKDAGDYSVPSSIRSTLEEFAGKISVRAGKISSGISWVYARISRQEVCW